jgi:hypothetical protein
MTDDQAQLIALRHYRSLWYGKDWDTVLPLWQTEYNAVTTGAFQQIIMVGGSFEGASHTSQKNFEQINRLAALQKYRAAKDYCYAQEVFAAESTETTGPTVTMPLFSNGAFFH